MKLTAAQERAIDRIRLAGGYVPLVGSGPSRHPDKIDPRTVEKLIELNILETVADEDELRIEGVRFTPEANIKYLRKWRSV